MRYAHSGELFDPAKNGLGQLLSRLDRSFLNDTATWRPRALRLIFARTGQAASPIGNALMPMPRPQVTHRALLALLLAVACFFAGIRFEKERRRRAIQAELKARKLTIEEYQLMVPYKGDRLRLTTQGGLRQPV
jgi:hypothetical protein